MPVYANSDQLYRTLKSLFNGVVEKDPGAVRTITNSRLFLRMKTSSPITEINFNGRQTPLQIIYGSSTLRPDIELEIPADLLHGILLSEITMRKAYSTGKIKLRGPVWKALVFENIFHAGQQIYPIVFAEHNNNGNHR